MLCCYSVRTHSTKYSFVLLNPSTLMHLVHSVLELSALAQICGPDWICIFVSVMWTDEHEC